MRDRTYSPSPLACASGRVDEATPSPSKPCTTTLSARRFGSSKRSMGRCAVSGPSSVRSRSTLK